MRNKKFAKTMLIIGACAFTVGAGAVVISLASSPLSIGRAVDSFYKLELSSSNGAFTDYNGYDEVKTNESARSTAKDGSKYQVNISYVQTRSNSGGYCTIKEGGYIALATPLHNIAGVEVTTSAVAGKAKISWGTTSACADGSSTTLNGGHAMNSANFFKIETTGSDWAYITSIVVTYGCAAADATIETEWSENQIIELNLGGTSTVGKIGKNTGAFKDVVFYSTSSSTQSYPVNDTVDTSVFEVTSNAETYKFAYADSKWSSNNAGISSSTAKFSYTAKVAGTLTGSYSVSSEATYDKLTINGKTYSGTASGTFSIDLEANETGVITYSKDSSGNRNNDMATLSDVNFVVPFVPDGATYPILKFDTKGGSAVNSILTVAGASISNMPADPTKTDANFKGWYTDSSLATAFDPSNGITGATLSETTVYAKWQSIYTVSFYSGSDLYTTVKVNDGDEVVMPADPLKDGMIFDGWYTDAALTTSYVVAPVTSNISLYAHFSELPAGASFSKPKAIANGETLTATTNVAMPSYYFSFTAPSADKYYFAVSNATINDSISHTASSTSPFVKVYDSTQTKMSVATIDYPTNTGKAFGDEDEKVGVTLDEGESIFIQTAPYENTTSYYLYGTVDLTVSTAAGDTLAEAADVTYGTATTFSLNDDKVSKLAKYVNTLDTDKDVLIQFSTNKYANVGCYSLISGTYAKVAEVSGTSSGSKGFTMKAGVTYVFSAYANNNGTTTSFTLVDAPAGYSPTNPVALAIGADPVSVNTNGQNYSWYSFTLSEAKAVALNAASCSSTTQSSMYVYAAGDVSTVLASGKTVVTVSGDGEWQSDEYATSYSVKASLAAGSYLVKVGYAGSTTSTLSLALSEVPAGTDFVAPISASWSSNVMTVNATTAGAYYSFTDAAAGDYDITVAASAGTATVSAYKASATGTVIASSSTSLHLVVEAETAYIIKVVGTEATTVTLTRAAHVGALASAPCVGNTYMGIKNGSSYYQASFTSEGIKWESSSTVYEATGVATSD